ncbi:MAG: ribonuclease HI [Termitinemataceae bacterium]|nr:MAG: ribonuclease HI [Termitinemataceae bacterium]
MITIYTDGGCHGNPGPGGWAYVVIKDGKLIGENSNSERDTTNNKMELSAVIAALEFAEKNKIAEAGEDEITVLTDSQYVQKGISEWIKNWKRNGWRTKDKKAVKNAELWQKLDALNEGKNISWKWVKGHAGNTFNERCDALVQDAILKIVYVNNQ